MRFLPLAVVVAAVSLLHCNTRADEPARAMRGLPNTPGSPHNSRSSLGTNLEGLADYSVSWPFSNAFLTSRAWISSTEQQWDDGRTFDLDENGWVRSLKFGQWARTLMLWDLEPSAMPTGDVVITWVGTGVVEASPHEVVANEARRLVVRLDPKRGGLVLTIKATDPKDPVRDIRAWLPGFGDAKDPPTFHPAFLDRLRPYKVLRFMDWMNTNGSNQRQWKDRTKKTAARYTAGAPIEVSAELCNTLKADPWITVPHLADDDYVEQLAQTLLRTLDRDRAVYVEYSNELWNGAFPQARYANERGRALALSRNDYEAQLKFGSQRAVEIFRIFSRVFGGDARLVRIIASQAANAWSSEVMLAHKDAYKEVDALAIAPYFGGDLGAPDSQRTTRAMSLDALFTWLEQKSVPQAAAWVQAQRAVAARFGLPLIAYEAGQHLAGVGPSVEDPAINALFDSANRDPRMKGTYARYLAAWKENGGTLLMHFVDVGRYTKWGRWGAAEAMQQNRAAAPKLDALMGFNEMTPPWWKTR